MLCTRTSDRNEGHDKQCRYMRTKPACSAQGLQTGMRGMISNADIRGLSLHALHKDFRQEEGMVSSTEARGLNL